MYKTLFWKEWRQNRLGIFISILFYLGYLCLPRLLYHFIFQYNIPTQEDWIDLDNQIRFIGYYLFCGLIAISMGALMAEERSKKTLLFLFIHPISRTKIWFAKVYFSMLLITFSFLLVMLLHRLLGAPWIWGNPKLLPVYPYSIYVALAGFSLGIFIGVCLDNSTTAGITTILGLIILYFGLQYFGKLDWQYIVPLFFPISIVFITISHLIFCSADYWYKPFRKEWYKKIAWVVVPLFILSCIPFLLEIWLLRYQ
jgi:ABC-type transport system involved in multi-copper enzyme maturation permease subunit